MGCGSSSTERLSVLHEKRRASVKAGPSVVIDPNHRPRLIFVFGGPGSKKGKIIGDIQSIFGLKLLNVENIVMNKFLSMIDPDQPKTSASVLKLVKDKPELLRLDWTLKVITSFLDELENKDETYIIDFLPNLKFICNSNSFSKDCQNEFNLFEGKYPIGCALYFAIPSDQVVKQIQTQCAHAMGFNESSHSNTNAAAKKQDNTTNVTESDEANVVRTKKRAQLFEDCVKPFVDYFRQSGKLIETDVSKYQVEEVEDNLLDFFLENQFNPACKINTSVLFAFGEEDIEAIDLKKTDVCILDLAETLTRSDPPAKVIEVLKDEMNQHPFETFFVANLEGTSVDKLMNCEKTSKMIMFQDSDELPTDLIISSEIHYNKRSSQSFRTMCTLSEAFLFPKDVPDDICKWITNKMNELNITALSK